MKKLFTLLLAVVMVLSMAACGAKTEPAATTAAPTEAPVTEAATEAPATEAAPATQVLTDNVGREVELPVPVDTCVVANRYNSELIRACGAVDHIIAVDTNTAQDRVYWEMFDPENVIGKSQRELNYEKIIELNPQVVILPDNGAYEEAEEKLTPFGIKVFVISGYDTADFKNQTENIGKMFGVEEQAAKFYNFFNDKLEYINEKLEGVEKRTVYFETTSDYSTIFEGNAMYNMVEFANVTNIFSTDTENLSAKEIDPEAIIARNPDVIIKLVTPDKALAGTGLYTAPTKEEFQKAYNDIIGRVGFDSINAVKNDDIYFMTQFSHGGASKLVGTLFIAKMVYPDLLTELDADEIYRAWLEDFQGFDFVDGHFWAGKDLH